MKFLKSLGITGIIAVMYIGINLYATLLVLPIMLIIATLKGNIVFNENMLIDPFSLSPAIESIIMELTIPSLVVTDILVLIGALLILYARNLKAKKYLKIRKFKFFDGVSLFALGMFLNILVIALMGYAEAFLPITEQIEYYNELMENMMQGNQVMIFIAVVIGAPIVEETLLRGMIFNEFRKSTNVAVALFIQAFIFGLMHMNIIQGSYAFLLGLVLGCVYIVYDNLYMAIIVHFAFNITSTFLDYVPDIDNIPLFTFLIVGVFGTLIFTIVTKILYDSTYYKKEEEQMRSEGFVA